MKYVKLKDGRHEHSLSAIYMEVVATDESAANFDLEPWHVWTPGIDPLITSSDKIKLA